MEWISTNKPEGGDDARSVLGLLLGDDDPLSVGLDRLALAQPDGGGRRRPVDFSGEDELAALLHLRHLGEVALDRRLDRHEAEEGRARGLPSHVLRRYNDLELEGEKQILVDL